METGDEPVVYEAEGEVRVFVERDHPAFLLKRIIANFARLVIALIAASRFKAKLRLGWASCQTSLVGRWLRVYRDALPLLCCWQRRFTSLAMPV
jgi:uncharacterized protein (DUF2236 family)